MNEEFKRMMGDRQSLSDGFTYDYGKYDAFKCRTRDKTRIKRCVRADKRKVKNNEKKYDKRAEGE